MTSGGHLYPLPRGLEPLLRRPKTSAASELLEQNQNSLARWSQAETTGVGAAFGLSSDAVFMQLRMWLSEGML